nr:MAG TPA: hypothetical protein [Caudoviricetes sp.]
MARIAENTIIFDGQEYKPGDVIPDFKSIKCVDTRELRKYQGLSADVSVLNDVIAKYASDGASCFMSDTGEYYEYDRKEKTWKLITNITQRGFDSEKAYGALKKHLDNIAFGLLSKKKGVSIQNGTVNIILYPEDNNHVFCVDDNIKPEYECQFSWSHIDTSTGEEIITQINPMLKFNIGDLLHVRVNGNYIKIRTIFTGYDNTNSKQESIYRLINNNQWYDESISYSNMGYYNTKSGFNQGLLDFCTKCSVGILEVYSKQCFVVKLPFEHGSGNVIVIGDMADGMVCKYSVNLSTNGVKLVKAL